ncbi:proline racemase family protein [Ruegeria faecimaris]|uniref:proline racemase family protein n=1 Tax=Ruegeria faecimaris TaxID=686389 RepID=UPI00249195D1|nr:proline racemase family protein [Ruegeria faecimaris]
MPKKHQGQTVAIDVDLAGDILRVAVSGLPKLVSRNAASALLELRSDHEQFRGFLNLPPNGNHLINSCLLYPPFEQGTDGALFLASQFAYAPYAGTALMAAATIIASAKRQALAKDQQVVALETANGVMEVQVTRTDSVMTHAKWFTVKPKLLINNQILNLPLSGNIPVSLVDAGLPYLVVDADYLGISLSERQKLTNAAIELSGAASKQFPMSNFGIGGSYGKYLVMFSSKSGKNHIKTVWASEKGELANSAGGTGALSVVVACEGNGSISPGRSVTIEAPGGIFECQVVGQFATVSAEVRIVARHSFPSFYYANP